MEGTIRFPPFPSWAYPLFKTWGDSRARPVPVGRKPMPVGPKVGWVVGMDSKALCPPARESGGAL